MLIKTRALGLCLCMAGITACSTDLPMVSTYSQPYPDSNVQFYPGGYGNTNYVYSDLPQEKPQVEVPDSYHVGSYHSPTPHTDMDKAWVNKQNAQSYTIELGDGDKPSQVANTLYKAPKDARTAEIKYQREGKTYYKGVYGTYPSYEEAQQALNKLPAEVKQNAGIKTWSSVQNGLNEQ